MVSTRTPSLAIAKVFDFIAGGGEIDVNICDGESPGEEEESDERNDRQKVVAEIRASFKEIKHLEKKARAIADH